VDHKVLWDYQVLPDLPVKQEQLVPPDHLVLMVLLVSKVPKDNQDLLEHQEIGIPRTCGTSWSCG